MRAASIVAGATTIQGAANLSAGHVIAAWGHRPMLVDQALLLAFDLFL
jgi:hypothetical protein